MGKILVIAEIGISWNGNMKLLKEMVLRARECGCDIIKTQLYDPAKLFPSKEILVKGKNWYSEVEKTKMSKEQLFQFVEWCREVEAEPMASAFDLERLAWLEEVGVKRHKIGSRANQNRELITAMAKTGKEVLVSCRHLISIYSLFNYVLPSKNLKYLYCIPKYPTSIGELGLSKIDFPTYFQGLSDHTIGIEASMIAMARGAKIIEKHFCLKRDNSNPDMVCSIEPGELGQLSRFARKVEEVIIKDESSTPRSNYQ